MQYALLVYSPPEDTDRETRPIPGALAARLDRPDVTGWARLHAGESASGRIRSDSRTPSIGMSLSRGSRASTPSR